MDKEIIKDIVRKSINAPSGDNTQPWYFSIENNILSIFKKDTGDNSYLDFRSRGTFVAHGALLENIILNATAVHYRAVPNYFPQGYATELVATISFIEDPSITPDYLHAAILERTTNRKGYREKMLDPKDKEAIVQSVRHSSVGVAVIESEKERKVLFEATTQMERIALGNKLLHRLFFASIVWSKQEEQLKRQGLYIKTMELPPPIEVFFRLLRYWPVAKLLSCIGFPKKVAQTNALQYQSSPMALVFYQQDVRPESFIETGRAMERAWLAATINGVAVQPHAGVVYVQQRLVETNNQDKVLTDKEITVIARSYANIASLVATDAKVISMILRFGYASAPSAKSSKKSVYFKETTL